MHKFEPGDIAMITSKDHYACGAVVEIEYEEPNMGGTYHVSEHMGHLMHRFHVHGMDLSLLKVDYDSFG